MSRVTALSSAATTPKGRQPYPSGYTYRPQVRADLPERARAEIDMSHNAAQPATRDDESSINSRVKVDTVRINPPDVDELLDRAIQGARSLPSRIPEGTIQGLQKWNGRVLRVVGDCFEAELVPQVAGPTVVAEFDLSLLGDEDVRPGDAVYVTVRTVRGPGGLPHRTSQVRLRRLGLWDKDSVEHVRRRAKALQRSIARQIE